MDKGQYAPAAFLAGMYAAWIAASATLYVVFRLWPESWPLSLPAASLLYMPVVLLFAGLGCRINAAYLLNVEPAMRRRPAIRYGCLLAVLAAGGLMVLAARQWEITNPGFYMVYTANLLVFANLLGAWIVSPLRREAELVLVCMVMALADLFSILQGPTRRIVASVETYYRSGMDGPPPAGDFLLIKIPAPGLENLQPLFGVSDWIIVAFLSAAALRFRINDNLFGPGLFRMETSGKMGVYFPLACAGLVGAVFAAGLLDRFIPALPVVAAVFVSGLLIRCPAARRLTSYDFRLMTLFAAGMLIALVLAALVFPLVLH